MCEFESYFWLKYGQLDYTFICGKFLACSFHAIINNLLNQSLFYFQQLPDPRAHTMNLSVSLSLPRASTDTKTLSEDLLFKLVSFLELL